MSNLSEVLQFVKTKKFAIHLGLIAAVTAIILLSILFMLDDYTLHGEEITVPEIVGASKEDLSELLEGKDLSYVILDSVYMPDAEKGVVLAQNPKPLTKVKKHRTIYISVSAALPPSVKLPLLHDKSLRQAKSILENSGLKLGRLSFVPDLCMNCVLMQTIEGVQIEKDTVVPKGTVVDLVLGGGLSDEKILVPKLINLTREAAIRKLKESFLNLGAELYDESVLDSEDSSNARVFSQYPPYHARSWLQMGSSVDIEFTLMENKIDSNIVIDSTLFKSFEKDTAQ